MNNLTTPILLAGMMLFGSMGCGDALGPEVVDEPLVAIAAGFEHTCALTQSGRGYCWGRGEEGQLGNGGRDTHWKPVPVKGGHTFVTLAAGDYHTCGLTGEGVALCWGAVGDVNEGQLGTGSFSGSTEPVAVDTEVRFESLAAGQAFTCAVSVHDEPFCWGHNRYGQLGDGSSERSDSPVRVVGSRQVASLDAGTDHACAATLLGEILCWGNHDQGQLGTEAVGDRCGRFDLPCSRTPLVADFTGTASNVITGRDHTCAWGESAPMACWGRGSGGALGRGSTEGGSEPAPIVGGLTFSDADAGGAHTCGITPTGTAYCWGASREGGAIAADGRAGDCGQELYCTPLMVPTRGSGWTVIAAGQYHTCALTHDGIGWCWGGNDDGALGVDPSTTPSCYDRHRCHDTPVRVSGQP